MHLEKLRLLGKLILSSCIFFTACNSRSSETSLPVYGERDILGADTIFHQIPYFSFENQDGKMITSDDYQDTVYIADFFFTTCPGICPIMTKQLVRVQKEILNHNLPVKLLSHTVDPETDSAAVLLNYAKEMKADLNIWNFVTGDKQRLYKLAESYLVVANEDPETEIQFVHSDKLVLVDKQNRIRGMYSGIDSLEVNQLIEDLKRLVKN